MQKGYWEDSTKLQFDGEVTGAEETPEGVVVRFGTTYFYPESGGQLADRGTVAGIPVLTSHQDERGPFVVLPHGSDIQSGQTFPCVVDAECRGRHTQLHSVQHLVSRLLENKGIHTLSFHMTEEDASIEIDTPGLSSDMIDEIEDTTERMIWKCLPVDTVFVDASDVRRYNMRKIPELSGGPLRLVRIADFDTNPCGGTHVHSTGEIGGFAITHADKVRGNVRLYFVAGRTATSFRRHQRQVLEEVEHQLTCGLDDIASSVSHVRELEHRTNRQIKSLLAPSAEEIVRRVQAQIREKGRAVLVMESVPGELMHAVMKKLGDVAGAVCLVTYPDEGSSGQFVCSVPEGDEARLTAFSARMKESFGARMGGSAHMVQGKLEVRVNSEQLEPFLA